MRVYFAPLTSAVKIVWWMGVSGREDHDCRARKQARQGRVKSNRTTEQPNINKTAKHYIHTSKQNLRISLGFYRIHGHYTRT
jgi:hypothetical protein